MNFQQSSVTGINQPTQPLTKSSGFGLAVSTTATNVGDPVILKAISDAAMYKTIPVSFYADNTYLGVTTTYLLGTATFTTPTVAPLIVFSLATGTNQVYAEWPGQNKFAPVTTKNKPIPVEMTGGAVLNSDFILNASPLSNTLAESSGTVTLTAILTTSTLVNDDVTFWDVTNGLYLGQAPLIGNTAIFDIDSLSSGTHYLAANWPGGLQGDGIYYQGLTSYITYTVLAGTPYVPPTVNPQSDTIVISSIDLSITPNPSMVYYQAGRMVATINSTEMVGGYVNFYNGSQQIGNARVINNTATYITANFNTGTYYISAQYPPPYGSSSSIKISNTVTYIVRDGLPSTLAITKTPNPVYQLDMFDVTVTDSATGANLINAVNLYEIIGNTKTLLSSTNFLNSNITHLTVDPNNFVGTGTNHSIQAFWGGQGGIGDQAPYKPAISNISTESVTLAHLSLSSGTRLYVVGENITLTATTDQSVGAGIRTASLVNDFHFITSSTTFLKTISTATVLTYEMNSGNIYGFPDLINPPVYTFATLTNLQSYFNYSLSDYAGWPGVYYRIKLDKIYPSNPVFFIFDFYLAPAPVIYPVVYNYTSGTNTYSILGAPGYINTPGDSAYLASIGAIIDANGYAFRETTPAVSPGSEWIGKWLTTLAYVSVNKPVTSVILADYTSTQKTYNLGGVITNPQPIVVNSSTLTIAGNILSSGTYHISAVVNNTNPLVYSNSSTVQIVNPAATTLSLSVSPNPWQEYLANDAVNPSNPVATINLSGTPWAGHIPSGTITLKDMTRNVILGTTSTNGIGSYYINWSPRTANQPIDTTATIQAFYSGDAWNYASTSSVNYFYPERDVTTLVLNTPITNITRFLPLPITVTKVAGAVLAGDIFVADQNVGTFITDVLSNVIYPITGSYDIQATYIGDTYHEPIVSNSIHITVNKVNTPITFKAISQDPSIGKFPSSINGVTSGTIALSTETITLSVSTTATSTTTNVGRTFNFGQNNSTTIETGSFINATSTSTSTVWTLTNLSSVATSYISPLPINTSTSAQSPVWEFKTGTANVATYSVTSPGNIDFADYSAGVSVLVLNGQTTSTICNIYEYYDNVGEIGLSNKIPGYIIEGTTRAGKMKARRDYIYDCTPISYYVF